MNSLLSSLALLTAVAAFAGTSTAQINCYESQIGTSVGTGDDTVLAMQPLGFAFAFGGTTYTDIYPCTNGFVYLTNGGTPAAGGSLCCAGSTANLVAGGPKICARLDDLNIVAATAGAGVYVNQMPGKCVITWKNAVEYGNTVLFDMQCQLYATGEIVFFYSNNVTARTAGDALVGFSPGNAATVPAASDFSVTGLTTGTTAFQIFNNTGTANWDLGGKSVVFVPSGTDYAFFDMACGAFHENYGAACYDRGGSVYESFPAGTFDLSGQTVTATLAGSSYFFTSAPVSTWFTTTTNLGLTDDSVSAPITLPAAFPNVGGSASSIVVASNGRVFLGTVGNTTFTVATATLLADARSFGVFFDFNPTAGGTVEADYDAVNNQMVVTWNGVFAFGTTNPNTWQLALSCAGSNAPGTVEWRMQSFTNNSTTNTGTALFAYSQGATTLDPGSMDISAAMPFLSNLPLSALSLSAAPIPLLGSTVTYTLANIPATALLSANIMSLGDIPAPGFDLSLLGAPGCWQHVNLAVSANTLLFGSPTAASTFTVPNNPGFQGMNLYVQGASLVPGVNGLGAITSNGVHSQIF